MVYGDGGNAVSGFGGGIEKADVAVTADAEQIGDFFLDQVLDHDLGTFVTLGGRRGGGIAGGMVCGFLHGMTPFRRISVIARGAAFQM